MLLGVLRDNADFWRHAFVVKCGDELQLPPVPEDSSVLAPPTDSKEHAAGVKIFAQQGYCYRLTTMMRFHDELLVRILRKMRQPQGCELTAQEWSALQSPAKSHTPNTMSIFYKPVGALVSEFLPAQVLEFWRYRCFDVCGCFST